MDDIFVNEVNLRKAIRELDNLNAAVRQTTQRLCSSCKYAYVDLDKGLQRDVYAYVNAAIAYQQMIQKYVDENKRALEERLNKLIAYNRI